MAMASWTEKQAKLNTYAIATMMKPRLLRKEDSSLATTVDSTAEVGSG